MKNIKRYVHWKVVFTLFFMGLLGAFNPVAAQRPQPLSSLERSLSPNMMMMSNGSRYASYKYFSEWLSLYGDSLNILNPFWLGSILPSQNVNIAAAGNNLTFSQGGIFSFVADTSLAPAYNYQFNVNPKIAGGQGLFRAQNVSNGYYNGLLFNQLGLTLFADNNLVLANPQVQSGALAPGVYEAEFDESGALEFVEKDTCGVGVCWDSIAIGGVNNAWNDVVYGDGKFVAVSENGANRIGVSYDGVNWELVAAPQANAWTDIEFADGLFVAISYNGTNRVMYSRDGYNWSLSSAATVNDWISCTYGNDVLISVTWAGRIMRSTDGINWSLASTTFTSPSVFNESAFGNNLFVAIGDIGTLWTSEDGDTWTKRQLPAPDTATTLRGIAYGNGYYLTKAQSGNNYFYSEDAITWVKSTMPLSGGAAIDFVNGLFVVGTPNGILVSPTPQDSTSWREVATNLTPGSSWYKFAGKEDFFVGVARAGVVRSAVSGVVKNMQKSYAGKTFGDITLSSYPNTRNDAGVAVNIISTSSTGAQESHPLSETFASLSAQNTSDQTLTTGVNNAIRFQNVSFTSGSNITITNDTLITINQTGVYELSFDGRFDASASTENTSVQFIATNVADMGANFAFSILTTESVIPMKRIFQVTSTPATIRVVQEATTWASGSVLCAATSSLNIKRLY